MNTAARDSTWQIYDRRTQHKFVFYNFENYGALVFVKTIVCSVPHRSTERSESDPWSLDAPCLQYFEAHFQMFFVKFSDFYLLCFSREFIQIFMSQVCEVDWIIFFATFSINKLRSLCRYFCCPPPSFRGHTKWIKRKMRHRSLWFSACSRHEPNTKCLFLCFMLPRKLIMPVSYKKKWSPLFSPRQSNFVKLIYLSFKVEHF